MEISKRSLPRVELFNLNFLINGCPLHWDCVQSNIPFKYIKYIIFFHLDSRDLQTSTPISFSFIEYFCTSFSLSKCILSHISTLNSICRFSCNLAAILLVLFKITLVQNKISCMLSLVCRMVLVCGDCWPVRTPWAKGPVATLYH